MDTELCRSSSHGNDVDRLSSNELLVSSDIFDFPSTEHKSDADENEACAANAERAKMDVNLDLDIVIG